MRISNQNSRILLSYIYMEHKRNPRAEGSSQCDHEAG